jgi:hypothetical protein
MDVFKLHFSFMINAYKLVLFESIKRRCVYVAFNFFLQLKPKKFIGTNEKMFEGIR